MPPRAALKGGHKMISALARRLATFAAIAGLGALLAGCVSDAAAPASQSSGTQLRYYGGPKSPMWPAAQ
jgi:hypothetical protein